MAGCQPKAHITTIENPMTGFVPLLNDSVRGAATIQDLADYLFLSLRDDMSFEQLSRMIPDSGNVAMIYEITNTDQKDANLKAIADTAKNQLFNGWKKTRREAAELRVNWTDATFAKLQVQDVEDQKLPSKKIMLECKAGGETLRASALCLLIGNRWYIGQDIKFGV